jgi:hypothetical protein
MVLGITWLARSYGLGRAAVAIAITCYLANAVILNELHAGHLHFLFSYALLPFFLAAIRDERTRNRWLLIGSFLGLAGAQQQFFFFALVLGIGLGVRNGGGWLLRTGLPALVVALCFAMPQWILSVTAAGSYYEFRPLVHWEQSQSVPFTQAVRFLGYIGGYDKILPAWLQASLWIFPLLALAGTAVVFARRRGRLWPLAAICCVLVVNGFDGPLRPLLWFAADHSTLFVAFRELYNLEAIVALSFALLIATAIDQLIRSERLRVTCLAATFVMVIVAGAVAVYSTRGIPWFQISPAGASLIKEIAATPGFERYLPVPSGLPQTLDAQNASGLSPFTLPIGNHPSAVNPLYETPYSSIAAMENSGASLPESMLRRLAISFVLSAPGIKNAINYEPQLRNIFPPVRAARQRLWQLRQVGSKRLTFLPAQRNVQLEFMDYQAMSVLDVNVNQVDPRRGWVHTALWNNLPSWIYDRPAGIFTTLDRLALRVPAHTTVVAGSRSGHIRARGCVSHGRLDEHYLIFDCHGAALLSGTSPVVVSEAFAGNGDHFLTLPRVTAGRLSMLAENRWRIDAFADAAPGALIVLRERFDPGWQCDGCNAQHVRADGFANAWIIRRALHGNIRIIFRPAYYYFAALWLSIGILFAAMVEVSLVAFAPRKKVYRQSLGGEK